MSPKYLNLRALTTNQTACSIEIATRAADNFTKVYYTTYDSATRVDDLPHFYRPTSSVTWNGNPVQGADGVRDLLKGMPKTVHEVQDFDCHPIPGEFPPLCFHSHSNQSSSTVLSGPVRFQATDTFQTVKKARVCVPPLARFPGSR